MSKRTQDMPVEYTDYERALAVAIGARIRQRRNVLRLTQEQVRIKMETKSVSVMRARFSRIEKAMRLRMPPRLWRLLSRSTCRMSGFLQVHEARNGSVDTAKHRYLLTVPLDCSAH